MKLTIEVEKYFKNDTHVCAEDFNKQKVCEFYRTQRFGTTETCLFAPLKTNGMSEELIRIQGTGLIPGNFCIFNRQIENDLKCLPTIKKKHHV